MASLFLSSCTEARSSEKAEAPPPAKVIADFDPNNFIVEHPELFPLTAAVPHKVVPELNVTGVVQPDVARTVPVVSLAAGRVVAIKAQLGDSVKKGQLLVQIQSNDVSSAYQTYAKAVHDEILTREQLARSQSLYNKGAIAESALEAAQTSEQDAKTDLNAAAAQLRLLGVNPQHPSSIVNVIAPISGVVTEQHVTDADGVQGLTGPNLFTISDLSYVWIVCDVYENDLDAVHIGQLANVKLSAYPNKVFRGRIDNILPILDPTLHTAKVRIEVRNPGLMRVGMFVTATFFGKQPVMRVAIPATAVLHLHDRDWVYQSLGNGHFKRQEVTAGDLLPGNMQEINSGLTPGDQVISNALELQNTVEQ